MADLRIPGPLPPAAAPARQGDASRSARAAFFQAALNSVTPSEPTRPAPTQAGSRAAPTSASFASPAEPSRYARPGSLLDIKV